MSGRRAAPDGSRRGAAPPASRGRWGAVVAAPVVAVLALVLVPTGVPAPPDTSPEAAPLTRTDVACPPVREGAREIAVAVPPASSEGSVALSAPGEESAGLEVAPGQVATEQSPGSVVVTGTGELAPGLVAARRGEDAAVTCTPPSARTWFTGLGARPQHSSVLELRNPDPGPAVAEVRVLAPSGELDVPALRGVRVAGGGLVSLDLAALVPRRVELAVEVSVVRGRISPSVWDRIDELGAGSSDGAWLAGQSEPAETSVLLGLPEGEGGRTLVLANGGDSEARADLQVVAPESVFTPAGLEELTVAPGAVLVVPLGAVLGREVDRGALGLVLTSTHPLTSTVRSFVGGRLTHAVAAAAVSATGAVLVPPGAPAQMLLAGATGPGVVELRSRAADGTDLPSREVEVGPDRGVSVRLPRRTALVEVVPARTSIHATLVSGSSALPVTELVTELLVPDVRPALP